MLLFFARDRAARKVLSWSDLRLTCQLAAGGALCCAKNMRGISLGLLLASVLVASTAGFCPRAQRPSRAMGSLRMVSLPSPAAPTRTGGPATVEKERKVEKKVLRQVDEASVNDGMFQVVLFNDEMNTREYVARVLVVVCNLSEGDAYGIMEKAHRDGYAVVGVWGAEVAEMYTEMLKAKGLQADMTEA